MIDDDGESLSTLDSQLHSLESVPKTVMMVENDRRKQHRRTSDFTHPSTCASSVASVESSIQDSSYTRKRNRKKSSRRLLEKELIAHLREELASAKAEAEEKVAQARAEAETNRALVQKLIAENEMIRQEANEAHARADHLEEKVEQLSSPAVPFGVTWRRATQSMRMLNVGVSDKEEVAKIAPNVKFDESSCNAPFGKIGPNARRTCEPTNQAKYEDPIDGSGVRKSTRKLMTVEIPIKEGVDERVTTSKSFRNLIQRATSVSTRKVGSDINKSKPSVASKEVTAEALLWDSYDWQSALNADDFMEHGLSSHQLKSVI